MDWNWSWRAFRLFGVDVRIHWSLFAFFLYYVIRDRPIGYTPLMLGLLVVLPMVLLFASVIAHEYGHVFAARYCRLSVGDMTLTPIGGMVMVAQGTNPKDEAFVAIAGPLVNLGLAIFAAAIYFAIGGPPTLWLFLPFFGGTTLSELWHAGLIGQTLLFDFINQQLWLFLFNVLCVAYPMDGGRVLMSYFWRKRGFHQGLIMSCKVARVIAILVGLAGLVTLQPMTVLIAFFIFMQATTTMQKASLLPDPGGYYGVRPQAPRKKKPSFIKVWLEERKEKKLRALLARAETKGIGSLSAAEREWLKKARESRMN